MQKIVNWLKFNKFESYLILFLIALYGFMAFNGNKSGEVIENGVKTDAVYLFYHDNCGYCHKAMGFIDKEIKPELKNKKVIYVDIAVKENLDLLMKYADKYGIDKSQLGTPAIFVGDQHIVGYGSDETTGKLLKKHISAFNPNFNYDIENKVKEDKTGKKSKIIKLPIFGEIDVFSYSLPTLSVVLGFIDGFNPCATWMLAYLISLVIGLDCKKKMWTIVGIFVAAEGILYYLFMTAWLNLFLIVGYLYYLTLAIGMVALYSAVVSIRTFMITKGALQCPIGDAQAKKKTMSRMERVVNTDLSGMAAYLGVIALAFAVNSIEFMCSAAIPAVYTNVLANSDISSLQHYTYLLIYDIFYMLDDFIIFGLAVFAIDKYVGDDYAKWCKLIGGIVLGILGILMVFFPEIMR